MRSSGTLPKIKGSEYALTKKWFLNAYPAYKRESDCGTGNGRNASSRKSAHFCLAHSRWTLMQGGQEKCVRIIRLILLPRRLPLLPPLSRQCPTLKGTQKKPSGSCVRIFPVCELSGTHRTPARYTSKQGDVSACNPYKNLTYEKMEQFISALPNSTEYRRQYDFLKPTLPVFRQTDTVLCGIGSLHSSHFTAKNRCSI